ncbi:hypothetical protein IU429_26370 [Nocardia elegans]|uniref:Integral membrane protein n=1 Tax=Nocardia elegans TaxID=300029 RepID=A0ABW6TR59_9NOCA|nr:hypothetical protein [Nocardia elegans]MBF6451203.1 hypothetical protein [Nocardia elegans]
MSAEDRDARPPASDAELSTDDRAELERLRAYVAAHPPRPSHRHAWRWTGVVLLLVLTALLIIGSVTTRFVRSQIFDTDRYVTTVAPLATDPAIQKELADKVTDAIVGRVDIKAYTADAVNALTQNVGQLSDRPRAVAALNSLPALVADQAENYIHQAATAVVTSDQFREAWDTANRRAHDALVHVVKGETRPGIEVSDNGTVSISLKPILATVRERLDARGISFADKIPDVDTQFVIFHATELPKYQKWLRTLDRAANILPWVALATAAGAVWLAPRGRRLRTLALVGVAGAVAMVLLAVGVVIARSIYLDSVPPDTLSPPAASALFDTVIHPMRVSLRAVAVVGLVVAAVGYLAGSSHSAQSVRSGFGRLMVAVRGRRGRPPNVVESFVAHYRTPLRLAVLAGAVLVLVLWPYATGLVVVGIVLVAGALLLIVEILARPAAAPETTAETEPTATG